MLKNWEYLWMLFYDSYAELILEKLDLWLRLSMLNLRQQQSNIHIAWSQWHPGVHDLTSMRKSTILVIGKSKTLKKQKMKPKYWSWHYCKLWNLGMCLHFSVTKVTLESQIVCPSICHKNPSASQKHAYQPNLILSQPSSHYAKAIMPLSHHAPPPLSLSESLLLAIMSISHHAHTAFWLMPCFCNF